MAKITLTVEGSTIGTATIVTDLNQAQSDALVAYLMAMHGTDAEGNPRNLQGVVEAYWDGIYQGTLANVDRHRATEAAEAARAALVPMADLV